MEQFRDRLIKNNEHTHWVPDAVKVCTHLSSRYFDVEVTMHGILWFALRHSKLLFCIHVIMSIVLIA